MAGSNGHKTIEVRRAEWLASYPSRFLACRQGHNFPKPIPGRKKMPRTQMEPWHDPDGQLIGCVYIEQSCGNCGRIRWKITGPRGSYYGDSTKWHYNDPRGYATPKGLGLTYADYAELFWARLIDGEPELEVELSAKAELEQAAERR
jgi:hypothetical protein